LSNITTHVLDTATGRPAAGVPVSLERREGDAFERLGHGETDADGRLKTLLPQGTTMRHGVYRMTFTTSAYFARTGASSFYPEVAVLFEVTDDRHHHVPLLLSPFGYSTYRGS
jgi:5-hydroxyisourate hydrolase